MGSTTLSKVFKYTIYLLLAHNVVLFFQEERVASSQVFIQGMSWSNIIESYSASIDTASWLVLLLIFELETYILHEEQIKGLLKTTLNLLKSVAYLLIIYSCYGYLMKYNLVHDYTIFNQDPCSLVGSDYSYIIGLDEYDPINAKQCLDLSSSALFQLNGTNIIGTESSLEVIQRQAFVDVLNSVAWLLVVFILEVEVSLKLRGALTKRRIQLSAFLKALLYSTLFFNAIYWWVEGSFLDFFDAFLWIIAFIFIEMNMFGGKNLLRA